MESKAVNHLHVKSILYLVKILLYSCVCFMTGTLFSGCQLTPHTQPSDLQTTLDQIIRPYVTLGADVGIVVGVIQDGKPVVFSYGETSPGSRQKISTESLVEIASLTKPYTALALARMHLQGQLNLDDPIENYLPATVNVPSYQGTKITLRHLANHTSGLPAFPDNMNRDVYNSYKGYDRQKMYEFLNGYTLSRKPGSEQHYSNVGYGLLGHILSLKNKTDYQAMLTEWVLSPLQMNHTTVTLSEQQRQYLVYGHNGNQQVESWAQYQQDIFQGSGSLISSLNDQLVFLQANLQPGSVADPGMQRAILLTHTPTFFKKGKPTTYTEGIGLAWTLVDLNGQQILWKNGANGGYNSFMGFNKSNQTGVVILVNSSLNPEAFPTHSGFQILEALQKLP